MPKKENGITQAELAAKLGISQQRVSQLLHEGILPSGATLEELLIAYGRHNAEVAARWSSQNGQADVMLERALLDRAKRAKLQIEIARMQGNLLPESQVAAHLTYAITAARAHFLGLAHRYRSIVPYLKPADVSKLDSLVREILINLAQATWPPGFKAAREKFFEELFAQEADEKKAARQPKSKKRKPSKDIV